MNLYKSIIIIALPLFILSCDKDEGMGMNSTNINLTKNVVGEYNGTLLNLETNTTKSATTEISRVNDFTVKLHCYNEEMDTTFLLDLYQNGDMMMVCNNGDDFVAEYGHQQNNTHSMMQGNDCIDWDEHMDSDHDSDDEHYGAFNIGNNSFEYSFNSNSNNLIRQFKGVRK